MKPYLGCLVSGAPDLEGGKNRKTENRKKGKKGHKGTGRKRKKKSKKKKHCHKVGLQFVTDILGGGGVTDVESSTQKVSKEKPSGRERERE